MSSAADVGRRLKGRARKAPGRLTTALRELADETRAEITPRTPVDTGEARRSWRIRPLANGARLVNVRRFSARIHEGRLQNMAASLLSDRVRKRRKKLARQLKEA